MRIRFFHFGEWQVDASSCTLIHHQRQQPVKVEPRAMDVLVALCSRPGEIFSAEDLLRSCWDGLAVGDNQVHKAIAQLRKLLGDDPGQVRYIENIRKRGYRTVAPVTIASDLAATGSPGDWSEESPFVGLEAFDESRSAVFFGRDTAIAALRDTMLRQAAMPDGGPVLVLGASGSGKTSLIRAGLLPALRRPDQPFRLLDSSMLDMGDISGMSLLMAVGGALLDLEVAGEPLLNGHSAETIAAALADDQPGAVDALFAAMAPDTRVLLFVDRLEAIFNNPAVDEGQRRGFLAGLDRLARTGAVLVLAACRNDFYPDVAREPVLMAAKAAGAHFDLAPPSRAEIMQMIRMPALAAGLSFGMDEESKAQLDDILCDGTADNPDALPLLQYTLHELYLQRSTNRELTVAAYRALGGIGGAIGKRAEATLNELPEASRLCLPQVLSLIVTMGGSGVTDGAARSRRMPWSSLGSEMERILVRTFVQQRLFVSLVYDGVPVFGVAHEAMLRQWPRVTGWIAQHRQALNARSRLEESARRWTEEGRRVDLLLPRGKQLEEARELTRQVQIPLSGDVRAFITASARRERQADQRRFVISLGFGLVALVALLLGLRANQAEDMAEHRRRQAEDLMNFMVGDFAEKLRPLGRLDLLSDIGGKALSYFGNSNINDLSPEARMQQARALQTIAEVARARADPNAARSALLLAKKLLDANLAQGIESLDLLKDLGADAFWLGQIAFDANNMDEAERYFSQYENYTVRMNEIDPGNIDAWIELSYAKNSLGSVYRSKGNGELAVKYFQSSLELKRRSLEKRPDDRGLRAELADTLSWLGTVREGEGELGQALALYEQEQVELRALRAVAPSEFRWTYDLVTALQRHARLLDAMGHDAQADTLVMEGQALARSLILHDPSNRIWQHALLRINWLAGNMWVQRRPLKDVLTLQQETAEKLAGLTRENPSNAMWRQVEIANNISMGETLLRMGAVVDAREHLRRVLAMADDRMRGDPTIVHNLSLGFILLSETEAALGKAAEAKRACQDAINLLHPLIAVDQKKFSIQDVWVRGHICLGLSNQVSDSIKYLELIGYRRRGYLLYVKSHS
ncbi:winged helix-turn-helix domain-containing protein [Niveispirillum sp. BGYR6]|uniref:nSTAND1 domain-containing NTPase n=1 Tax=Niveispirillum sp. BGYR6 TaxID=2971249 RepID=UPI0022B94CC5|nr:winged helix-turn-helix domain-containing protein [Niveispirillum sp. BGYR6]MDG5496525.1 winged helix-turn-helix domain-containing protein [Niveispirillum sp. BGYR6]